MNIFAIVLLVLVVVIIALQLLGVPISQKAINLIYGIVLALILLGNSGIVGGFR